MKSSPLAVTTVLGLDGQGGAQIFADYWQWERAQTVPKQSKAEKPAAASKAAPAAKKKLSYMEAREWEQMEQRILEAEQSLESIRIEMHSPEVVSDGPRLQATSSDGLFDGSPRGWSLISWHDPDDALQTVSGEIYFNEFYRPGLLADLLDGHRPTLSRPITSIDRRQPSLTISATAGSEGMAFHTARPAGRSPSSGQILISEAR